MKEPKKILIFRTEHIGDYSLSLPSLKSIRQNFPRSRIDIAIGPWNKAFAEATPYIDKYIIFDNPFVKRHIKYYDFLKILMTELNGLKEFFLKIRKEKYDLLIVFSNRKFIKLMIPFLGIKNKIIGPPFLENENETSRLERMLEDNGIKVSSGEVKLKISGKDLSMVNNISKAMDGKKVVIHPITPLDEKNWPLQKWSQLINELLKKRGDYSFALIGTEKEKKFADKIIENVQKKERVLNICGKLNIIQTIYLMKKSNLIVGCDSGPVHFAELTPIKIISLFGPTNVSMWGPPKSKGVAIKKEPISKISVKEVLESVLKII